MWMSHSLDLARIDAGEARAADLPISCMTNSCDPTFKDGSSLVSLKGTGRWLKS